LEAMVDALDGQVHRVRVRGPLGDPVDASYGIVRAPEGTVAVVEMASASGLTLLPERRRDPLLTTTWGTGELVLAAMEHDPARVIVCIGGSATNDGGAGMAQALGTRMLDAKGAQIGPGGAALLDLRRIDMTGCDPRAARVRFSVACDVNNPLTGPTGASAVYGPQKGADADAVSLLDRALGHFAAVVAHDLGVDVRDVPGAGAAGGLGAGLVAFLGAQLRPGVEVVMDAVGFEDRLRGVDLVLTGEGSFDEQSLHGKTAIGVVDVARQADVTAAVLCGRADVAPTDLRVLSLVEEFGEVRAMEEPRTALEDLAASLAGAWKG
ncbi:MAG: glycerate kinase, partial [Actinobacteria bacterium]|nr:glycerate kinase [Actinomycetota bacterium]